jgi:hypothetical protein
VNGGTLRYADTTRTPAVDIAVSNLQLEATGLRNRQSDEGEKFPATIAISGQTPGHGQLKLFSKLEPLALQPHLDLTLEVKEVSLPVLNNFLRSYANVDVSKGRFELYGQLAVGEGRYEGYVKPFLDQLDFKDFPNQESGLGKRMWETVVGAVVKLLKNKEHDKFATRIPFSGEAGKMDVGTWTSIANALHNGFIEALHQGFEGTTHPDNPETKVPSVSDSNRAPAEKKSK